MHLFSPIFRKNIKTRRLCVVERKLHLIYLCIVTRCCVVHVQFRLMLVAALFPCSDLHLYHAASIACSAFPLFVGFHLVCEISVTVFVSQRRVGLFSSLAMLAFYFQHVLVSMENSNLFFVLNSSSCTTDIVTYT